jgi:hypothetical protein
MDSALFDISALALELLFSWASAMNNPKQSRVQTAPQRCRRLLTFTGRSVSKIDRFDFAAAATPKSPFRAVAAFCSVEPCADCPARRTLLPRVLHEEG